ncbi:MAG: DUF2339 domain-containing protein [Geminicoccaceae bacterium]|nr:DUF2339 domain-containing protein [Geminicoccaceae bacterium]
MVDRPLRRADEPALRSLRRAAAVGVALPARPRDRAGRSGRAVAGDPLRLRLAAARARARRALLHPRAGAGGRGARGHARDLGRAALGPAPERAPARPDRQRAARPAHPLADAHGPDAGLAPDRPRASPARRALCRADRRRARRRVPARGRPSRLLGLVFVANPVVTGEPVGPWPVLNLLLPANLLPEIAFLWAARGSALDRLPGLHQLLGPHRPVRTLGIAALALAFLWSSLEVRRRFHALFVAGPRSDAEYPALSLAWLALAGGRLLAGIVTADRQQRAAALGIGGAPALEAFLFDLADLEGLHRAASFLALGLGLVAVGRLLRRFVAEPSAETRRDQGRAPRSRNRRSPSSGSTSKPK